jgi:gas vesicle protein
METNKNGCSGFWKGLLIGSFFGTLSGILFAPKSGKELRSDVKKRGTEAFEEAKQVYSDSRMKAKAILDEAKYRADELKKEADRHVSEARLKMKEILAGAEERASQVMGSVEEFVDEKRRELKS